ncbi:MAG: di-heme oxidoredictase family protein [Chthoniobacterales bacterium]
MKITIVTSVVLLAVALSVTSLTPVEAQTIRAQTRKERFTPRERAAPEGRAQYFYIEGITRAVEVPTQTHEARTGFDNRTNGFAPQGPDFETINEDNVNPLASFNDARFVFEEVETYDNGLGPIYNAQSCRECHQNVVTGGASQVAEHRTGHTENDGFFESMGGSLVQSRATAPEIVEHVVDTDETRTFRMSSNTLGEGYVECISDSTLTAIRDAQPEEMRGLAPEVPVLEGDGRARIGRFGWKSQHASLVSFAADAYVNEVGITSPLFPDENTSSGVFVGFGTGYDPLPEPDNDGTDVEAFALFMRSTKAPARGPITNDVRLGQKQFDQIGCSVCHVSPIVTAAPGTLVNGGAFKVPAALGNKIVRPFSDFLLHDIGTGDGIPIQAVPEFAATANKMRTAPLWGLRTRNRLMHDGLSFTKDEAIQRHAGQAAAVRDAYNALDNTAKAQLLSFLDSL